MRGVRVAFEDSYVEDFPRGAEGAGEAGEETHGWVGGGAAGSEAVGGC